MIPAVVCSGRLLHFKENWILKHFYTFVSGIFQDLKLVVGNFGDRYFGTEYE